MLLDILVFFFYNIKLYKYGLMEKDSNILLDILVFFLTILYCTCMY